MQIFDEHGAMVQRCMEVLAHHSNCQLVLYQINQ